MRLSFFLSIAHVYYMIYHIDFLKHTLSANLREYWMEYYIWNSACGDFPQLKCKLDFSYEILHNCCKWFRSSVYRFWSVTEHRCGFGIIQGDSYFRCFSQIFYWVHLRTQWSHRSMVGAELDAHPRVMKYNRCYLIHPYILL